MINTSRKLRGIMIVALALVVALAAAPGAVIAEDAAGFYKGKTVRIIIRSTPGGGYDFYGRLVARHLGKYIPGNPNVIPVNKPGAGGLVATNYMYGQAPKDGTELLIASREIALSERLGSNGVRYKTQELIPIGSAARATRVWLAGPEVPVKKLTDMSGLGRPFRFAVSGKGAGSYQLVTLLERAGYPATAITGYEGTSDQIMAVLRGEADGSNHTYGSARDVIRDENMTVIAKLGDHPDLADVQDVRDAVPQEYKALASVLGAPLLASRPFFTAPGTPKDRVEVLRTAFRKALQDPDLLAEAKRAGKSVDYTSGEEMVELYREILNAPDHIIEDFRE